MSENIIAKLKTNYKFLTKTEKKIAQIIVDTPREFIACSMQELSEKASVSQGSINNFSKKVANCGYADLKLIVSAAIATENKNDKEINLKKSILDKTIESRTAAFNLTSQNNSEEILRRVADKILNARKVEIYGIYRSAAVATDFCYQLLESGIPASFVSDILTCSVSASMLTSDCLVVAVSASGQTKDIIDAVNNAKENGVPIVAITSNINSPLAKLSDDVLVASSSGPSSTGGFIETRTSQLLLTDALCSYIGSKKIKSDARIKDILNSHNIQEADNE